MPALQLSFNGTFALKKEDLLKILKAAQDDIGLKDNRQGLMERTGLGNEKVLRIKSWAKRSGLVNDQILTPEGQIVVAQDPDLNSPVTDWLMHFYLSFGDNGLSQPPNSPADWGGWTWFVYEFVPEHFSFSVENLVYAAGEVFTEETSASLKKNFRYILRAYTEAEAIAACRFLQHSDSDHYIAGEAEISNPYMVAYFLANLWDRDYGEHDSIVTDEIINAKFGLAAILGLEPEAIQNHLDKLQVYGLIEQRRTVPPFQVIRRWDTPLQLLEQAYANT